MVKGVKRYGAKVKTPGKKSQMRIGSTFADPQSALTAAQVFKRTAIVDHATGIVSLDPMRCQLEQDKVCCVYRNRSMDVVKVRCSFLLFASILLFAHLFFCLLLFFCLDRGRRQGVRDPRAA